MRGRDERSDGQTVNRPGAAPPVPVARTEGLASGAGRVETAGTHSPQAVAALQRTAGNAAVAATMAVQRRPRGERGETASQAPQPTVQRMFNKLKNAMSGTSSTPAAAQVMVRVGGEDLPMTRQGAFYVYRTDQGGQAFIHDIAVRNGVLNDDLTGYVMRYRAGGLALYRGIPRWHATWHDVNGAGVMNPLGRGNAPDFDTHNTSFIPFSPDEGVARSAAVAATGMGERDRIEYVNGYSRSNGQFFIGLLATVVAGPGQDVAFFNGSEIQLRGPVRGFDTEHFRMSTDVMEALRGRAGDPPEPLGETRPHTPDEDQKKDFARQHGALLP
ncbi:hypothetical protein GCM10010238_12430 [Streptomyces griseoviridis]|uniref:Uncharacterized protein n=3 Tax=Streptomyces TaxID=1883 RepID=A0A918LAL5_STRGD|nr:hypothetical protein GCM10010238_12430 [Streptomyces niveoruber]